VHLRGKVLARVVAEGLLAELRVEPGTAPDVGALLAFPPGRVRFRGGVFCRSLPSAPR